MFEAIRERARQDLVIPTADGLQDVRLWEHSQRVLETALMIAQLPDVAALPISEEVLTAAALYHDAGWVSQFRDGDVAREAICCRLTSPVQRELSAALMETSLRDLLTENTLESASQCIRVLSDHEIDIFEAQLIAEADSLDEFGALYIWYLSRRHARDGKGIADAIETWRLQNEYGYWTARIKDSFRFDSVRQIAHERLVVLDRLIESLSAHHTGKDLRQVLADSKRHT